MVRVSVGDRVWEKEAVTLRAADGVEVAEDDPEGDHEVDTVGVEVGDSLGVLLSPRVIDPVTLALRLGLPVGLGVGLAVGILAVRVTGAEPETVETENVGVEVREELADGVGVPEEVGVCVA